MIDELKCNCKPSRTTNGNGYEIQAHSMPKGYEAVGAPYPCKCKADKALSLIPVDGVTRRTYEALK